MIPCEFEYHAPKSIPDALSLLSKFGGAAKLLAGGHSLLPMMKLRFAEPGHLIVTRGKYPPWKNKKKPNFLDKLKADSVSKRDSRLEEKQRIRCS
jgi:FAD binding domain in molybdopterin dehydrogenase